MLTTDGEADSRRRPRTPSRVLLLVGAAAVLIGFAGSATAAVIVTGKQIKDNTITTKDLRDGDLLGLDVRDKSLTEADFGQPVAGPPGPKGDPGPQGPQGTAGLVYVIEPMSIPKGTTQTWGAKCPSGTRVLSGGGSAGTTGLTLLTENAPIDLAGSGWWVGIRNKTTGAVTGYAWALCVSAP